MHKIFDVTITDLVSSEWTDETIITMLFRMEETTTKEEAVEIFTLRGSRESVLIYFNRCLEGLKTGTLYRMKDGCAVFDKDAVKPRFKLPYSTPQQEGDDPIF